MKDISQPNTNYTDSKPHYQVLDGLRGVAALMVIWFHIFEAFASSPFDQVFNHGYLAVDFFFVLSGFVISYAYDDRWNKMSTKNFFIRRLIRLHPMVILGAILGAISFMIQGSIQWDGTPVSTSWVLIALLVSMFLIPSFPGSNTEVRGNGEIFPLNGPSWSLFFEYIGNILYALFIRKLSTKALSILVAVTGAGLAYFAIANLSGYGNLGVGWSFLGHNFLGGSLRLMFSFSAGMLISRIYKPFTVKGIFWIASACIIILLSMPYIGNENTTWLNGLYDATVAILVFPTLVYLATSDRSNSASDTPSFSSKIYKFLGDISYPLYIIHYPSMYLFYTWVWGSNPSLSFSEVWPITILLFIGNIILAYGIMKLYDTPVRNWLTQKLMSRK
ncbi:acyltransferase [Elizabethkingia sp. JS20170427COW]|uniref:acyltransferase family protein n=1 Tax=Elizabethkingia sp. JS20170427COW TaxID=2583851 RepID=UPI00111068EA|nr:acyltransferase [Elizabethkingia sp. JS20170427COW]QCX52576.1 acyltransferase [Elizabethkingia sp. JS20170427COW]